MCCLLFVLKLCCLLFVLKLCFSVFVLKMNLNFILKRNKNILNFKFNFVRFYFKSNLKCFGITDSITDLFRGKLLQNKGTKII